MLICVCRPAVAPPQAAAADSVEVPLQLPVEGSDSLHAVLLLAPVLDLQLATSVAAQTTMLEIVRPKP